jgi:hypothetical protein
MFVLLQRALPITADNGQFAVNAAKGGARMTHQRPALGSPQRERGLKCRRSMGIDERKCPVGELDVILPRDLLDLVSDGFGDVARPAFFNIDRYDTERLSVLAIKQISDDRRGVGFCRIGLDIGKTCLSEPAQDKMDVIIQGRNERRMSHD